MHKESKILELGMINMLYDIKNPLTNIRLCLDLLESGSHKQDPVVYYGIMKESAIKIETYIRELCGSFHELGITLHIPPDTTAIE